MYRPNNWAIIKRRYCNEKLKDVGGAGCKTCPAEPQTCNRSFEAGADAILRRLRVTGMPTSPLMPNVLELRTLGDNPDVKRQVIIEKPSVIVVIPEEEAKDVEE